MKNKGFTLIELLGVIVLLGILALVVYPNILKSYESEKDNVSDAKKEILKNAAEEYVDDNLDIIEGSISNNNYACVKTDILDDYSSVKIDKDLKNLYIRVEKDKEIFNYSVCDSEVDCKSNNCY